MPPSERPPGLPEPKCCACCGQDAKGMLTLSWPSESAPEDESNALGPLVCEDCAVEYIEGWNITVESLHGKRTRGGIT